MTGFARRIWKIVKGVYCDSLVLCSYGVAIAILDLEQLYELNYIDDTAF